jgi:hypothetical protein
LSLDLPLGLVVMVVIAPAFPLIGGVGGVGGEHHDGGVPPMTY